MKNLSFFFSSILLCATIISLTQCEKKSGKNESFEFAFLTDIHIQPELHAVEGFLKAIDTLNSLKPDFIITGGDLIMDAIRQSHGRADSLFNLYKKTVKLFRMPVYNTMGNHDIYGIFTTSSGADPNHPDFGEKMFEKEFGNSYYSFNHKEWKFMILNSIEDTGDENYRGFIDEKQIQWIKSELNNTKPETPIVISTHSPLITAYTQKYEGTITANSPKHVITNGKDVLNMFKGYNLKLVLQGHLHIVEDNYIDGIHFITGGAVSGAKWKGPIRGSEEGFILVKVEGDVFEWKYVDYKWEVIN